MVLLSETSSPATLLLGSDSVTSDHMRGQTLVLAPRPRFSRLPVPREGLDLLDLLLRRSTPSKALEHSRSSAAHTKPTFRSHSPACARRSYHSPLSLQCVWDRNGWWPQKNHGLLPEWTVAVEKQLTTIQGLHFWDPPTLPRWFILAGEIWGWVMWHFLANVVKQPACLPSLSSHLGAGAWGLESLCGGEAQDSCLTRTVCLAFMSAGNKLLCSAVGMWSCLLPHSPTD